MVLKPVACVTLARKAADEKRTTFLNPSEKENE
jgi:hypothetical protein